MSWLSRLSAAGGTGRLVCLPYAGGGLLSYADWTAWLPDGVELWVPDLPGREQRMLEEPVRDMDRLVRALAGELLADARPTSLFGHSLGALVAFELARLLQAHSHPVRCLVVSGMSAPQTLSAGPAPTDADILLDIRVNGSAPPELYDQPELLELLMPGLRADYEMALTYRYREGAGLTSPVVALSGADDGEVTDENLAAWAAQSRGAFETRVWPGGHMYLREQAEEVARFVAACHLRPVGT
ncbi:alpha/beta fold hydrolase [Streptomyces sp. NPDC048106]|uniref:thioesterase II family protein n=1 Tax=Streptomyces sp. NPDC048106 TaxID=3155750 RepID=UPI00345689AE